MKEYEKHGFTSAEEAMMQQGCPKEEMTGFCLSDDCEGHWNSEVKVNCTIIEMAMVIGEGYPEEVDGKCKGYGKSEMDDEPIEECQACEKYEGYGVE